MSATAVSDRVGYVFQNPEHQFVSDTVFGELAFSLSPRAGRKGPRHLSPEQRSRVESWLDRLALLPLAKASPFALSQGQKRRLSVAAMLIRGQSILILDEPTLGQDEFQTAALMAMMQEFRAGGGTVAMITHDMRLVGEYADSLLVLSEGRVAYAGTPDGFFSQPEMVEAVGLDVPALGRVSAGLHELAGTPEGLHTAQAFLRAAARRSRQRRSRMARPPDRGTTLNGGAHDHVGADRPAGSAARRPARAAYLQRRNPSIKLLVVALAALSLTFIFDPVTPAVILVITLLAGRFLGGLGLWAQLKPMWIFVIAGVAILLANVLFNKENAASPALFSLGSLEVTEAALWAAGSLWLRLLAFALLSLVFVKTTEPQHLILSLVHQLHLNHRVAYGTMAGYRMLPLFQSDYQTIRAAQRVRGVRETGGFWHAWSRTRRYAIPLLAGAVRKAGRVAVAMDARAFGALPTRTYRERMVVRRSDWVFLAVVVAILAAVVVGSWWAGIARFTVG